MKKIIFSLALITFGFNATARPEKIDTLIINICGQEGVFHPTGDLGKAYQMYLDKLHGQAGIPHSGSNAELCTNQVGDNYDKIIAEKKH